MQQWYGQGARRAVSGWVLCLLFGFSSVQADNLTRREVQIMHEAGIRMALAKADGTSETPYVIPADIKPERLLQTELLDFSGQPLSQVPSWLAKFKHLRKLDLSNTGLRVDATALAALGNMPELSVLHLSGNPLFPENKCLLFCDPAVTLNGLWQKLTQLTELGLSNTGATAENVGSLAPLENLTHLYLGGNRIGDAVAALGLRNPSNLRELNLASNGIEADPLPQLPTSSLVELSLAENHLRELAFVDMPQLVSWDLRKNPSLKLAAGFGDMFALGSVQTVLYDNPNPLPVGLAGRMEKRMAAAKAAEEKAEQDRKVKLAREIRKSTKMVDIPAGTFTMGCVEGRDDVEGGCSVDEKPEHEVTLKAFKLAATEVTVGQYRAFVQATHHQGQASDCSWDNPSFEQTDTHPVVCVSWDDAQAYLTWLNDTLKPNQPFRLPTEAEWEYAARGGGENAYPWGQSIGKGNANCDGCGDDFKYTAPVGSFKPNGFGLSDLHGNVWEWVSDWMGEYPSGPVSAPQGAASGTYRVLRGGSWFNFARLARSAYRGNRTPVNRFNRVGFRPAQGQ